MQHHLQVTLQALGTIAIRFIDDEQVGDFHNAGLDGLDGIAAFWHQNQDRRIGGGHDIKLGLADAHRLHDDQVLAERHQEV